MKNTEDKKIISREENLITYSDASSSEEARLQLLANLLMNTREGVDLEDVCEIGHQIDRYLINKRSLDKKFWGRALKKEGLNQF